MNTNPSFLDCFHSILTLISAKILFYGMLVRKPSKRKDLALVSRSFLLVIIRINYSIVMSEIYSRMS